MTIFYFLIFRFLYYKGLTYISILLTNHFCFWKKYWPIHLDYVFFHKNRRLYIIIIIIIWKHQNDGLEFGHFRISVISISKNKI